MSSMEFIWLAGFFQFEINNTVLQAMYYSLALAETDADLQAALTLIASTLDRLDPSCTALLPPDIVQWVLRTAWNHSMWAASDVFAPAAAAAAATDDDVDVEDGHDAASDDVVDVAVDMSVMPLREGSWKELESGRGCFAPAIHIARHLQSSIGNIPLSYMESVCRDLGALATSPMREAAKP
jgi:hypothetical protein